MALVMVLAPLLVLTYLAGRRSASTPLQIRLGSLVPAFDLSATWLVVFDGDSGQPTPPVALEFVQQGARVIADGRGPDGIRHLLEGIVHNGRLCAVSIEERRDGLWVGTLTAELLPGNQQLTGMRSNWSTGSQTLHVRKVTFTRVPVSV